MCWKSGARKRLPLPGKLWIVDTCFLKNNRRPFCPSFRRSSGPEQSLGACLIRVLGGEKSDIGVCMLYGLFWKFCFLFCLFDCVLSPARAQSFEDTLSGADQSDHAPYQQPHLFGEWGGERIKLLHKGVRFDLAYASDPLWNVRGTEPERLAVFSRVRGTVDLDFSRL